MRTKALLAIFMAGLMFAAPVSAAAPGLNFSDDRTPNPYAHSSAETIAAHDLGEMDAPLELYDDEGDVTELPGSYNESQHAPFGVRWDKVEADAYTMFPRIDGESENAASWTETGQWTTNADASVSDADADGVQKVEIDATAAGGNATFAQNVSLDDPNKRVLTTVLNVDSLASATTVEVRVADGDGDYRYATIDTGNDGNASDVIANKTANGIVFQQKVGDLTLAGNGDGTLDSIESIQIVSTGGTSTLTVAALDAGKKSTIDFAEVARDTDGDGEDESVTMEDYWEGGESRLTAYDFGSEFSSATIHDWTVYDVRYALEDITDEDEYDVDVEDSPSSYDSQLNITADIEVPAYIDLSHGTLELRTDQGLIADRYGELETASVADDTPIGNLSDSDYTDRTGSLGSEGDTITLQSGLSADQQYRIHMVVYLKGGEVDALMGSMGAGPTGGSGGFLSGVVGFFTSIPGMIIGGVGGFLGLRRIFGGG